MDIIALKKLAAQIADKAIFPCCICLWGDLGAGKTTFTQGFIQALSPSTLVNSPTFNINQIYATPKGDIWHWDLYRIEREDELLEIGFDEIINNYTCIIEWPERACNLLPLPRTDIHFKIINNLEREIEINDSIAKSTSNPKFF